MKLLNLVFAGLIASCISCGNDNEIPEDPGWTNPDNGDVEILSVMSYNTRHCAPYDPNDKDKKPDIDGIATVIKAKNPDVVLLQEIDSCTTRSNKVDQTKELAKKANYPYYHFFKMFDYQGGKYGMAMLSKMQIKDAVSVKLPDEINGYPMSGNSAYGTASASFKGKDISFVVCHLPLTQAERDVQVPYIIGKVIELRKPIIWGGDFNATPDNNTIKQLVSAGFVRTNKNPINYTIPSNKPNREIDYISYFPNDAFAVESHIVVSGTSASDHLPIISALKPKYN